MKRILKNNTIIITCLCIMIAIVWYLNKTDDNKSQVATSDKVFESVEDEMGLTDSALTENGLELTDLLEVGEDSLVNTGLTTKTANEYEDVDLLTDISDEDMALDEASNETETADDALTSGEDVIVVTDSGEVIAENEENTSTPGEAVLASTTIQPGYFSSAKLTREQNRAREKEALLEMLENDEISEEMKQQAVDNILSMNAIMEKENSTEILLGAKGFDGAVVSIVGDTVDVVINAPSITEQQIAQIESIVKRKTGCESDNIVINPVVVEE